MKTFTIQAINTELAEAIQHKIDFKTKPLGALGQLEKVASKIALIQNTLEPRLKNPHIVVFAGDHGVTAEGVSPFPQEVTYQMVFNFLQGGAAINVFSKQNNIALKVVDAGVNFDFDPKADLIHTKVAYGTKNFVTEAAMSLEECEKAIEKGAALVQGLALEGCNVLGFGEMGIGNTSAAAALMHAFTHNSVEDCVGAGTGLDAAGIQHKIAVLEKAAQTNKDATTPLEKLAAFGGFEIAMMTGAFLQAAEEGMTILVDGFIVSAALLAASAMNEQVKEYCIFTHQSNEKGHQLMLQHLEADPLLDLGMRLGEGTGAAVAYPIVQSAVTFLNEMASFEDAGVSNQEEEITA